MKINETRSSENFNDFHKKLKQWSSEMSRTVRRRLRDYEEFLHYQIRGHQPENLSKRANFFSFVSGYFI